MKSVFKMVALAVLAVALLLVVFGLILPRRWQVERRILVGAEPATIHAFVEDLQQWPQWAEGPAASRLDYHYEGPPRGVGARRVWQAAKAGGGRLEIVRAEPQAGVWFESAVGQTQVTGRGSIRYQPAAAGTEVIWSDEGDLPIIFGGYLRDGLERQLTAHFDAGLRKLKELAEAAELAKTAQPARERAPAEEPAQESAD